MKSDFLAPARSRMIWSRRRTAPGVMGMSSLTGEGNIHRSLPSSDTAAAPPPRRAAGPACGWRRGSSGRSPGAVPAPRRPCLFTVRVPVLSPGRPTGGPAVRPAAGRCTDPGETARNKLSAWAWMREPLELLPAQNLHLPAPLGRQLAAHRRGWCGSVPLRRLFKSRPAGGVEAAHHGVGQALAELLRADEPPARFHPGIELLEVLLGQLVQGDLPSPG